MTEFVIEEECYLNAVPRELRDVGVLAEPLTIAEKSLEQLWLIQKRLPWACPVEPGQPSGHCHRAVVLGAGPVGLLGAMALRIAGFDVTVYSRSRTQEENNPIVSAIGARYIAAETHSVDELAKTVGDIDVVYEAVGASGVAFDVIQHLGPNGIFIFTGVPGRKGPMEVDTDYIMKDVVLKNQVILGSVNAPPHSFQAAIRDLGIVHSKVAGRGSLADHRALSHRPGTPAAFKRCRRHQERCAWYREQRLIDVSIPLDDGMVHWPGDAPFHRLADAAYRERRCL